MLLSSLLIPSGINTLKLSDTEGVGFAIPIDTAWQVIEELRTRGRVDRPQLGMRMVTADTQRVNGSTAVMVSLLLRRGRVSERGILGSEELGGKVLSDAEAWHLACPFLEDEEKRSVTFYEKCFKIQVELKVDSSSTRSLLTCVCIYVCVCVCVYVCAADPWRYAGWTSG